MGLELFKHTYLPVIYKCTVFRYSPLLIVKYDIYLLNFIVIVNKK